MTLFTTTKGTVVDVQRSASAKDHACRSSSERRELWLAVQGGPHRQFIVRSNVMPVQRGHCATVLTIDRWVVALSNATTGEAVNYVRESPPGLLRWRDLMVVLGMPATSAVALLAGAGWALLVSTLAAIGYLPVVMRRREQHRRRLQELVDEVLDDMHRPATGTASTC